MFRNLGFLRCTLPVRRHRWALSWGIGLCLGIATGGAAEYRSIDGTGNHTLHSELGSTGQPLLRMGPANFLDGLSAVDPTRPNPRAVSNTVFSQPELIYDERHLSQFVWAWGQFIDHDLSHTLDDPANGVLAAEIASDDPTLGAYHPLTAIKLSRSVYVADASNGGARLPVNNLTGWLDASMVYGGRAVDGPSGVDRASFLQLDDGSGKLKTSDGGVWGSMLPRYEEGISPAMANTTMPGMMLEKPGDLAYVAGDVRANENIVLTAMHTLMLREHNRLAEIISQSDANWTGDQIYQLARKIVGAEIQAVTYHEYLPVLGVTLPDYSGYDPDVDPRIAVEFSTAALRIGHSQVGTEIPRFGDDGHMMEMGPVDMAEAFFAPSRLMETGLEPLFRGLASTVQQATDARIIDDLRDQLFQAVIPGAGEVTGAVDLATLNLLRGRDHGVPFYNDVREAYGLQRMDDIQQITQDDDLVLRLQEAYGAGGVDQIDLFVGILSEDHVAGSSLGELASTILSDQFRRLRDGDRFWFQQPGLPVNDDLQLLATWDGQIVQTAEEFLGTLTLADIIRRNTQMPDIPDNVFVAVPEPSYSVLFLLTLMVRLAARRR